MITLAMVFSVLALILLAYAYFTAYRLWTKGVRKVEIGLAVAAWIANLGLLMFVETIPLIILPGIFVLSVAYLVMFFWSFTKGFRTAQVA